MLLLFALTLSEAGIRSACMALGMPPSHETHDAPCHSDDAPPAAKSDCCAIADGQAPVLTKQVISVRAEQAVQQVAFESFKLIPGPQPDERPTVYLSHLNRQSVLGCFLI